MAADLLRGFFFAWYLIWLGLCEQLPVLLGRKREIYPRRETSIMYTANIPDAGIN